MFKILSRVFSFVCMLVLGTSCTKLAELPQQEAASSSTKDALSAQVDPAAASNATLSGRVMRVRNRTAQNGSRLADLVLEEIAGLPNGSFQAKVRASICLSSCRNPYVQTERDQASYAAGDYVLLEGRYTRLNRIANGFTTMRFIANKIQIPENAPIRAATFDVQRVWPDMRPGHTFSNGRRKVVVNSFADRVALTASPKSGKSYFEFVSRRAPGATSSIGFGIASKYATLTYNSNGQIRFTHDNGTVLHAQASAINDGDSVGIAWDRDNSTVCFLLNGQSQGDRCYPFQPPVRQYIQRPNYDVRPVALLRQGDEASLMARRNSLRFSPPAGYEAGLYVTPGEGTHTKTLYKPIPGDKGVTALIPQNLPIPGFDAEEVHTIGVYESQSGGPIRVEISRRAKPIILNLSSHRIVRWNLDIRPNVQVVRVNLYTPLSNINGLVTGIDPSLVTRRGNRMGTALLFNQFPFRFPGLRRVSSVHFNRGIDFFRILD